MFIIFKNIFRLLFIINNLIYKIHKNISLVNSHLNSNRLQPGTVFECKEYVCMCLSNYPVCFDNFSKGVWWFVYQMFSYHFNTLRIFLLYSSEFFHVRQEFNRFEHGLYLKTTQPIFLSSSLSTSFSFHNGSEYPIRAQLLLSAWRDWIWKEQFTNVQQRPSGVRYEQLMEGRMARNSWGERIMPATNGNSPMQAGGEPLVFMSNDRGTHLGVL